MAATHWLDISLTLDSVGEHFLNFGEAAFVVETEAGLRELELDELADIFHEAYLLIDPLRGEIAERGEYMWTLDDHGILGYLDALQNRARHLGPMVNGKQEITPIYSAWVTYARRHPERVFALVS